MQLIGALTAGGCCARWTLEGRHNSGSGIIPPDCPQSPTGFTWTDRRHDRGRGMPATGDRGCALLLSRHENDHWGDLDEADSATNQAAVTHGDRILSCDSIAGTCVYVITEADRSSTCILLASEF